MRQTDWNFTAVGANDPAIQQICIWEYARECAPLIRRINRLRELVARHYEISDPREIALRAYAETPGLKYVEIPSAERTKLTKAAREKFEPKISDAITEIAAIVPHLNWGLFCSHEFPDKGWLEESDCLIKQRHQLWHRTTAVVAARVYHLEYDLGDVLDGTSTAVVDELTEELKGIAERDPQDSRHLHCFVVPDSHFDLFEKDQLVDAFKRHLKHLQRRKLIPQLPYPSKPDREHAWTYVHRLAVMRILHNCTKKEIQDIHDSLADEAAHKMRLHDRTSFSDFRREAVAVFHRIFIFPGVEEPLSATVRDVERLRVNDIRRALLG